MFAIDSQRNASVSEANNTPRGRNIARPEERSPGDSFERVLPSAGAALPIFAPAPQAPAPRAPAAALHPAVGAILIRKFTLSAQRVAQLDRLFPENDATLAVPAFMSPHFDAEHAYAFNTICIQISRITKKIRAMRTQIHDVSHRGILATLLECRAHVDTYNEGGDSALMASHLDTILDALVDACAKFPEELVFGEEKHTEIARIQQMKGPVDLFEPVGLNYLDLIVSLDGQFRGYLDVVRRYRAIPISDFRVYGPQTIAITDETVREREKLDDAAITELTEVGHYFGIMYEKARHATTRLPDLPGQPAHVYQKCLDTVRQFPHNAELKTLRQQLDLFIYGLEHQPDWALAVEHAVRHASLLEKTLDAISRAHEVDLLAWVDDEAPTRTPATKQKKKKPGSKKHNAPVTISKAEPAAPSKPLITAPQNAPVAAPPPTTFSRPAQYQYCLEAIVGGVCRAVTVATDCPSREQLLAQLDLAWSTQTFCDGGPAKHGLLRSLVYHVAEHFNGACNIDEVTTFFHNLWQAGQMHVISGRKEHTFLLKYANQDIFVIYAQDARIVTCGFR